MINIIDQQWSFRMQTNQTLKPVEYIKRHCYKEVIRPFVLYFHYDVTGWELLHKPYQVWPKPYCVNRSDRYNVGGNHWVDMA